MRQDFFSDFPDGAFYFLNRQEPLVALPRWDVCRASPESGHSTDRMAGHPVLDRYECATSSTSSRDLASVVVEGGREAGMDQAWAYADGPFATPDVAYSFRHV